MHEDTSQKLRGKDTHELAAHRFLAGLMRSIPRIDTNTEYTVAQGNESSGGSEGIRYMKLESAANLHPARSAERVGKTQTHAHTETRIYIYICYPPSRIYAVLLFAVLLRLRQSTNDVRPRATADVYIYATPPKYQ